MFPKNQAPYAIVQRDSSLHDELVQLGWVVTDYADAIHGWVHMEPATKRPPVTAISVELHVQRDYLGRMVCLNFKGELWAVLARSNPWPDVSSKNRWIHVPDMPVFRTAVEAHQWLNKNYFNTWSV